MGIGGIIAQRFGVEVSYALGYGVWLAFDFVGHAYVGENGKAAAFLGRHYIAWALVGQMHFAFQVAVNFPKEVLAARRCMAAHAKAAQSNASQSTGVAASVSMAA